jgi:predicted glycoside hydrolase/deacetylase ChbG (UPF0249 family)
VSIVINADDLGKSSNVNRAILESFERGLVTSATIMANMAGFEEACAMLRARGLEDRVGVHLNVAEGLPLTDPIRRCPRLCPAGRLCLAGTCWRLTPDEAMAIELELATQIEAALKAGIRPSHLDSHLHAHTHWPICTIVIRLARSYGVPAIRLTRNCGPQRDPLKAIYKAVFNARLARARLAPTRHFGSADDAASLSRFAGAVEIMTHPDLDGAGKIVDVTGCAQKLEEIAPRWRRIGTLVSYRELAPRR